MWCLFIERLSGRAAVCECGCGSKSRLSPSLSENKLCAHLFVGFSGGKMVNEKCMRCANALLSIPWKIYLTPGFFPSPAGQSTLHPSTHVYLYFNTLTFFTCIFGKHNFLSLYDIPFIFRILCVCVSGSALVAPASEIKRKYYARQDTIAGDGCCDFSIILFVGSKWARERERRRQRITDGLFCIKITLVGSSLVSHNILHTYYVLRIQLKTQCSLSVCSMCVSARRVHVKSVDTHKCVLKMIYEGLSDNRVEWLTTTRQQLTSIFVGFVSVLVCVECVACVCMCARHTTNG